MALTTKNGQIHIPSKIKRGRQKGLISKNGQISRLIPYAPRDAITPEVSGPTIANVMGVALANIANFKTVASGNISSVLGVDKE